MPAPSVNQSANAMWDNYLDIYWDYVMDMSGICTQGPLPTRHAGAPDAFSALTRTGEIGRGRPRSG